MRLLVILSTSLLLISTCLGQITTVDQTFNLNDIGFGHGDPISQQVRTVAIQPDGKILIGGSFTYVHDTYRSKIARLHPDGSLDDTFDVGYGFSDDVHHIHVQSNGKILVAGEFMNYNLQSSEYFIRLNPDGTLDQGFNGNSAPNYIVDKILEQPDGKIIISGLFTSYSGVSRNGIARINANGTIDATFSIGTGPMYQIHDIELEASGKVMIGGAFSSFNGIPRNNIARLNPNGSVDLTFDPGTGPDQAVSEISIQPDGRYLIAGLFTTVSGISRNRIARLMSDGSVDTSMNPGSGPALGLNTPKINCISLLPGGSFYVGGDFTTFSGQARAHIVRLMPNGSTDATFSGPALDRHVNDIVQLSTGHILVAGNFYAGNGGFRERLTRLNANGSTDLTFYQGTGADKGVSAVAVQPDGRVLIGGGFNNYNGQPVFHIARLLQNGDLDTTFSQGMGIQYFNSPTASVNDIIIQPDGKILVCGRFTEYNGVPRSCIARINPDGSPDLTFNGGSGTNDLIWSMALQPDGKIVIGGIFTAANGVSRSRIARLEQDGGLDLSFDPGLGAGGTGIPAILDVLIQPDGKILASGGFQTFDGAAIKAIVRLNANGSLDPSFSPGNSTNNSIRSIQLDPFGRIVALGPFQSFDGSPYRSMVRLTHTGAIDTTFAPLDIYGGNVETLVTDTLGRMLIAGTFMEVDSVSYQRMARLTASGALDETFDFGSGPNDRVEILALQADGRILIGGLFTALDGVGRNRIARIMEDTPTGTAERTPINPLVPFPNPTTGRFDLVFDYEGPGMFKVIDTWGRILVERTIEIRADRRVDIDLSDHPPGLYLISVHSDHHGKKSGMVVKQ